MLSLHEGRTRPGAEQSEWAHYSARILNPIVGGERKREARVASAPCVEEEGAPGEEEEDDEEVIQEPVHAGHVRDEQQHGKRGH